MTHTPKTYRSAVEQTTGYHTDEVGNRTAYVRMIEVTTEGADYTDDYDTMSEAARDALDKWVEEMHDALVAIAWAEPQVRERVDQLMHSKEWIPENLQMCLDDAKSEMALAS